MKRTAFILILMGWAVFGFSSGWGQEYGGALDRTEQQAMAETFQYALEYNKIDEESSWVNPDTGHSGAVLPVETYVNEQGPYCREYIQTIIIGGEEQQGYGTACRQPDGTWQIVAGETTPGAAYAQVVEKTNYVYVYRDPHLYYYPWVYYYPYYPHRIFFSFVFVHHSGVFRHAHFTHVHFNDKFRHHRHVKKEHIRHHPSADRHHFGVSRDDRTHRDFRRSQTIRRDQQTRGTVTSRGDYTFRHDRQGRRTVESRRDQNIRRDHDIRGTGTFRGNQNVQRDQRRHDDGNATFRGNVHRNHGTRGDATVRGNPDVRRDHGRSDAAVRERGNTRRDLDARGPNVRGSQNVQRGHDARGTQSFRGHGGRSFDGTSHYRGARGDHGGRFQGGGQGYRGGHGMNHRSGNR
jgi:surface antigen